MSKRIEWIDIAKGILAILVVIGHAHVNSVADYIINSFHLAGFYVLSGITFSTKRGFKDFVINRAKTILIPYAVLSALLLLYQFVSSILFHTQEFDIVSGLLSVIIPVSGRAGTTVYHLWFLPSIFLAGVLMYGHKKLFEKNKIASVVSFIFVIALCVFIFIVSGKASVISTLPAALFFMLCGVLLKRFIPVVEGKKIAVLLLSLATLAAFILLNYYFGSKSLDLSSMNIGIWPIYLLSGLSGSLFVIALSCLIGKNKILSIVGKGSLYYYGLHYEFLGVFKKFCGAILSAVITIAVLYLLMLLYFNLKEKGRIRF